MAGAQPRVTLPIGVNVLSLTVDDGKGGSSVDTVIATVNVHASGAVPNGGDVPGAPLTV